MAETTSQPTPPIDGRGSPQFYERVRLAARLALPFVARLRVEGLEHIPPKGPFIIALNHISWMDIPLVSVRIPPITHYMAKIELFSVPVLGWIMRNCGSFAVRRGESDREALRIAARVLAEGEVLAIFPEGHRSGNGQLARGLEGMALIARRSNVPVIPIGIAGSEQTLKGFHYGPFRPSVTVRIGEPIILSTGRYSREDLERDTETIMRGIAALLPPAYRGVYAQLDAPATPAALTASTDAGTLA